MRRVFFWLHLTAGVLAGVVILVMSVTGTLLMYERQMTTWADGYVLAPPPGSPRLSVETLAARVREARPESAVTSITLRRDATAPAAFGLGRESNLFVDPYTGQILGEGSRRARAFFRAMTDWHRFLGAQGESRAAGRAVTGASNLVFLFIVLSGIYLWWPRTGRPQVRPVVLFQGGLQGKARDFNWHNVIGLWSAVPLVFVVASALVISYPWAADLVYRATGSEPPARRGPQGPGPGGAGPAAGPASDRPAPVDLSGLDRCGPEPSGRSPPGRASACACRPGPRLRGPSASTRPRARVVPTGAPRSPSTAAPAT